MITRIPGKDGDEWDCFSERYRRRYGSNSRHSWKCVKRGYNRRFRRMTTWD